MTPLSTPAVARWATATDRVSRDRRRSCEGTGWYVGLALFKALGFVTLAGLVAAFFASAANAATVHATATRASETTLLLRLDVTVRHGTTIYLEGCPIYDETLACGGGAPKRVKLHSGHNRRTVAVSNMAQHYTPPPAGTAAAWDAWAYGPSRTDTAFLYFAGKRLTEVRPTATAAETLKDGSDG